MYARVSTYEGGTTEDYDAGLDRLEAEVAPRIRAMPGYRGVLSLVDRSTGRSLSITLWEDEDAIAATREEADRVRAQAAELSGASIGEVVEYEVGFSDLPGPSAGAGEPRSP